MTKRERVLAAIRGDDVDRVPYSFWYHFPMEDKAGPEFIEAEVAFAVHYDVDILKVMHDTPYDLPAGLEWVTKPSDWRALEPLDPRKGGFGRHLDALHAIRKRLPDDRPMVDTLFSPFSYAEKLSRKQTLRHLSEDPDALRHGLAAIAESVGAFGRTAIEDGAIDGMYLASSGGQYDLMPEPQFAEVFLPHHRRVAEMCAPVGVCNVLHIHGTDVMWDLQAQMPAHVLHWSDRTTAPSLSEARARDARCFAGGVNEVDAHQRTPEELAEQVRAAIGELGGRKLIIATGCAVATDIAEENLLAIARAARGQ
ncbi:MAG TPA: uroporphyrinogen decarboxylase family protein [Armatimonadota bacterium]|nr:uroporphyrinogen decarboxylase family protein [Armatimonadota bacterium]